MTAALISKLVSDISGYSLVPRFFLESTRSSTTTTGGGGAGKRWDGERERERGEKQDWEEEKEGRGARTGGGEGYVSLGKLAEMSNSRALASNQRPNKTTLSRGASVPLHPCLRCLCPFSFVGILRHLHPFYFSSSLPSPPLSIFLSSSQRLRSSRRTRSRLPRRRPFAVSG